jgi:hypothetical protein
MCRRVAQVGADRWHLQERLLHVSTGGGSDLSRSAGLKTPLGLGSRGLGLGHNLSRAVAQARPQAFG